MIDLSSALNSVYVVTGVLGILILLAVLLAREAPKKTASRRRRS